MKILNPLFIIFFSSYLFSIPYFSRKYEISCSSCHTISPDLNKKGENFLRNAYKLEEFKEFEDKLNIKDDFLYLSKKIPISFLINLQGTAFEKKEFNYSTGEYEKKEKADFQFPYRFKILSGGILYKNISYYFGYVSEKNTSSFISDAYFYIKLLKNFNFKFGQFQISDQLFKSNLKQEENNCEIYNASPAYSYTNLYYDKGIQFIYEKSNFNVIFGIYNGGNRFLMPMPYNPKYPYDNISYSEVEYDRDLSKNYSFRIKKGFSNFELGSFYYSGRDNWNLQICDPKCRYKNFKNRVDYFGIDFSLKIKDKIKINAQYIERNDDNLLIIQNSNSPILKKTELKGSFFEILFFPNGYKGRYVLSLLFNRGNSDFPEFIFNNKTQEYYELDFSNFSIGLNYLLSRNIKILTELKNDFERDINKFNLAFFVYF